jgi:CheY-like chemotaxis protein
MRSNGTFSVLIADDNCDAADALAVCLGLEGYAVQTVHTGPAAVAAAVADAPDVAVLDLGLPGLDGFLVARELRHHPATRGTRLMAYTGYGDAKAAAEARAEGFTHHFVKGRAAVADIARAIEAVRAAGDGAAAPGGTSAGEQAGGGAPGGRPGGAVRIDDLEVAFVFDYPVWTVADRPAAPCVAFVHGHERQGPTLLVFTDEDAARTLIERAPLTGQVPLKLAGPAELGALARAMAARGVRWVGLDLVPGLVGRYMRMDAFLAIVG